MSTTLPMPPGDPGGVLSAAGALDSAAGGFSDAGSSLGGAAGSVSGSWSGAGEAGFQAAVAARQADAAHIADSAHTVAAALRTYGNTLQDAQTEIRALQTRCDAAAAAVTLSTLAAAVTDLLGGDSPDSPATATAKTEAAQTTSAANSRAQELITQVKQAAAAAAAAVSAASGISISDISATRQEVVGLAISQVGYQEQPLGSNNVPRYFGWTNPGGDPDTAPWCSVFASWVWQGSGVPVPELPYSGDLATWAQSHTALKSTSQPPEPGDLIFYGTGTTNSEHVAVVTAVNAAGQVQTVEGNTENQVSAFSWHSPLIDGDPESDGQLHAYAYASPQSNG